LTDLEWFHGSEEKALSPDYVYSLRSGQWTDGLQTLAGIIGTHKKLYTFLNRLLMDKSPTEGSGPKKKEVQEPTEE